MFWDIKLEKIIWTPLLRTAFPLLTFTISCHLTLPLTSPYQQAIPVPIWPFVSLSHGSQQSPFFFPFGPYRTLVQALIIPHAVTAATFPASQPAGQLLQAPALTATGRVSVLPTTPNPSQVSYTKAFGCSTWVPMLSWITYTPKDKSIYEIEIKWGFKYPLPFPTMGRKWIWQITSITMIAYLRKESWAYFNRKKILSLESIFALTTPSYIFLHAHTVTHTHTHTQSHTECITVVKR